MSPMRSKADLNLIENWVKLLQCKGLKNTHYCRSSIWDELLFLFDLIADIEEKWSRIDFCPQIVERAPIEALSDSHTNG